MSEGNNLPPADELVQVREEKKRLVRREQELREVMLTDEEARFGNDHEAYVDKRTERWLDRDLLKEKLGDLDAYKTEREITYVRTRRRSP